MTTQTRVSGTTTLSDIGLLLLRVGVGATMLQAGLKKFFDFSTTAGFMEAGGWRLPKFAAFMVSAAETIGGAALLLGVLTPLAACVVAAAMFDAWLVNVAGGTLWADPFNATFLLALAAVTLLFTGAGAISIDAKLLGRWQWPDNVRLGLLVAAILAAVATWILLNGTNPIHFTGPEG